MNKIRGFNHSKIDEMINEREILVLEKNELELMSKLLGTSMQYDEKFSISSSILHKINLLPAQRHVTQERMAEFEHMQWSHIIKYLFQHHYFGMDFKTRMEKEYERMIRQMNTSYKRLPELEKISDRDWARQTLRIIKGARIEIP